MANNQKIISSLVFELNNQKLYLHPSKANSIRQISVASKSVKTNVNTKKCAPKKESNGNANSSNRINEFNIQMLSRRLYKQLFQDEVKNMNADLKKSILQELNKHGLPGSLKTIPNADFELPPLVNNDIEKHFYAIAENQCGTYRRLIDNLTSQKLPKLPEKWSFTPGWTKYTKDGPSKVDFPDENAICFDVEICCSEGELPTIATAASSDAWYSWASVDLCKGTSHAGRNREYNPDLLIPLESNSKTRGARLGESFSKPKIVIGHNVSYDRARVKEQYWLDTTGLRFLDTMSLHNSISGVTSYQKGLLKAGNLNDDLWAEHTSLSSLSEIYKHYCKESLPKEERDIFVSGTLKDVENNFQSLVTYCANDVLATHSILTHLWPQYLTRFPHPATLAGMLELSLAYLPINNNWKRYVESAKNSYEDVELEARYLLSQQADRACKLLHREKYKDDLWLWDQDWTVKELKLKKIKKVSAKKKALIEEEKIGAPISIELPYDKEDELNVKFFNLSKKFEPLLATAERLPLKIPHLAGYPEWYRKLCEKPDSDDWKPGPCLISTSMRITPKLLSLTWSSLPLHYVRSHGWGYLVPYKTDVPLPEGEEDLIPKERLRKIYEKNVKQVIDCDENVDKSILHEDVQKNLTAFLVTGKRIPEFTKKKPVPSPEEGYGIVKLPHKDGVHLNVGNPLAKDFINKFTFRGGEYERTQKIIDLSRKLTYWKNNRERIANQFVVWLNERDIPKCVNSNSGNNRFGVILPQIVVCGTLTRRAIERTWMTASNAVDDRIGSELRAMVQAPPGYSIVGADVDSQELWIASLIGDSYRGKEHGCTPIGWMTLSGQKSDGTDMHSVTAATMGISRNHAKIINYARIYGAGQCFAERLLRQFLPNLSPQDAQIRALKMFLTTKGRRIFELKPDCLIERKTRLFYRKDAMEICKLYNKSVDELFQKPKWTGGSESAMFNRLEEIASSAQPRTPFLECRLSRALEPTSDPDDGKFTPTRINWVVQSGAVDFLHLMLVCARWLLSPRVRFCLSFHDEVRYLAPEKYKYETALALHVTNLLVRCFCVRKLGMLDLPQSVAFFNSVEVDRVLRKEASDDCRSPSNPHGLAKGYDIPLGESLDIVRALEKANNHIGTSKRKEKVF